MNQKPDKKGQMAYKRISSIRKKRKTKKQNQVRGNEIKPIKGKTAMKQKPGARE